MDPGPGMEKENISRPLGSVILKLVNHYLGKVFPNVEKLGSDKLNRKISQWVFSKSARIVANYLLT